MATKKLRIRNQLLSIKGRMAITNATDQLVYEARGTFALFSPTWRIYRDEIEVATVQRKLCSWRPTWNVTGGSGDFVVKRSRVIRSIAE